MTDVTKETRQRLAVARDDAGRSPAYVGARNWDAMLRARVAINVARGNRENSRETMKRARYQRWRAQLLIDEGDRWRVISRR